MIPARDPAIGACLSLARAISGARTVHETCEAALDALDESLRVTRAAILFSDEDGILRFKAWRELSGEYRRAMEGHTPWGPDRVGAGPVVVADVGQEPSLSVLLPAFRTEGIASLALVPLVTGGRVAGALMPHYSSPHAMSADEIEITEILAAQIALAFARTTAEEQARQREERLRFALDDLLAVLSHELRTPLNAIVGWVHILQSGTLTAERSAEAVRIIDRNAKLQAQVIEDILDTSRIIAGTLKQDRRAGTTAESPAGTPHTAAPDLAGVRVLVVDDDPDARHLLEVLLGELGAAITTADGAAAAIAAFGDGTFDIMIADIAMPDVDGYQLVRHIKVDHPTIPAIALTAGSRPEDRSKALAAGYDAHEPKPLDAFRLLNSVHSLIGSSSHRQSPQRNTTIEAPCRRRAVAVDSAHSTPDTIGEQVRVTAPPFRPPATLADEPALDAALCRAYHHLAGYWLHAFRGLLNGISLNLLVLGNAAAGAPSDLPAASVKKQLKELDSALTCCLDLSALDETADGLCDVLSLLERVRSFVEPLARSRRIPVELSSAVSSPFCSADPRVLHAVLVPTLVNVLLCASEGSALRIVLEDDPSGALSVEVRPDARADAGTADLGFRDAARRALRILGGDIRDVPDGSTAGLRLLLQRPE